MTLILTVQTRGSIWLVADRRLSAPGRAPIDDAVKCTFVEVEDGVAMLCYAGLGATALGSQPSQWVSNVLRGRHHPLNDMLQVVADAMRREFLPHLAGIQDARRRQHCFLVPSFVNGIPRVYIIDLAHTKAGYTYRYNRIVMGGALTPMQITLPITMAGSGAPALLAKRHWSRPLLGLVNAYNRQRVKGNIVADRLAQIAYQSYRDTRDGTVGPDCIVAWRNSTGGGAHAFYSHAQPIQTNTPIPCIARGIDMAALTKIIMEVTMPEFDKMWAAKRSGQAEYKLNPSTDELNQRLSQLPSKPDEKLR